jgi:hypothetical protein
MIVSVRSDPSCPTPPIPVKRILSFSSTGLVVRKGILLVTNVGSWKEIPISENREIRINPIHPINTVTMRIAIMDTRELRFLMAK